jgi:hypothetical protein
MFFRSAPGIADFSPSSGGGQVGEPILLKRGMYSTLEEWLNCAEYILAEGNPNVLLCERGIRTFETYTRNTLDLSMIPAVRKESHLPIFIDPSHGTGILSMIEPMSLAALVAGVDGLEIEVHIDPSCALSDKDQQLSPAQFERLMKKLEATRLFMLELDDKIDSGEMAPAEAKDRGAGGRQGSFPEDAGRGGRKERMVSTIPPAAPRRIAPKSGISRIRWIDGASHSGKRRYQPAFLRPGRCRETDGRGEDLAGERRKNL